MSQRLKTHSFEEVRNVTLDVLSGREGVGYSPNQYSNIESGVAEVFARNEGIADRSGDIFGGSPQLTQEDQGIFLEVFWSLFQQGIIVLGINSSNNNFPWCQLSSFGKKLVEGSDKYFFHDVSGYEKLIRDEIPQINDVTLIYLKEAMQAFRSGCLLSATVMLGVATEHLFMRLLDTIESNAQHQAVFKSVFQQKTILQKLNKFKSVHDQNYMKNLPAEVKEDFDTHFASLLSVMRTFRNQSGHPTGKLMGREQVFVLLNLFIPYGKKINQLIDHFK